MRRSNLILCSALASLLLVAWGAWNANADDSSADKIEGTWLFTITPLPVPGNPVLPFQALQTFNTGNTTTQTSGANFYSVSSHIGSKFSGYRFQ